MRRFEVRTDVRGDEPYAVVGSSGVIGWYVTRADAEQVAVAADELAPPEWNVYPQMAALMAGGPAT